ncbi:MAG: hypothetical protein IKA40_03345 [Clostridia bacterium]|nr:hypothetical protein [Clostridia bacterium]
MRMKRTILTAIAVFFLCAIAIVFLRFHILEPKAAAPTFTRQRIQFTP